MLAPSPAGSGVGVTPSWREQREGAGRPAGAGAPPEMLGLRDGKRGALAEGALGWGDGPVMGQHWLCRPDVPGQHPHGVTCGCPRGSHSSGSQIDRCWGSFARSPHEQDLNQPPPLPTRMPRALLETDSPSTPTRSQGCQGCQRKIFPHGRARRRGLPLSVAERSPEIDRLGQDGPLLRPKGVCLRASGSMGLC